MNLGKSLIEKIPVPVRELGMKVISLLPEGGRHSDILKSINTSILLFDNVLINTANGATEEVVASEEESFFDAAARAAKRLHSSSGANSDESANILLLLPTNDFIATSYSMNVVGEKLIRSALELQSHTLIPAYDEDLLLAVNAGNQEGVALWYNEREASRMFRAFEKEDLFLAAIMPRSLALMEAESEENRTILINDEEGQTISFIQGHGNAIKRLLTVNSLDLEQETFDKQWELETGQLKGETVKNMTKLEDWLELHCIVNPVPEYCFLPAGAIKEEKRINLARKSKVAAGVAACLVLLLLSPFVSNWMTLRGLQKEFERVQEQTIEPRSLQASIFDMEQEWGTLYEYPDQQIAEVLVSLNDVMQGALTAFDINEGVVDITGSAEDPAYLVELLAEKEEFYNVGQSTSTRGGGARFGIRLNLSNVDFENYKEKYPVTTQGR
jgi:type II secretory pathway component PulL